ncbi:GAF domain-containing sensor histidine kinase [Mangrovihabitans endophyticus]|uniref:Sensor histidine kinase n=1 Tax=Mangrovihabitans endophyticus TaxID=1751298 RepID=A0A8J3FMH0_9ACTN|nr:GAF domain-containing sensor histidine kinase [Mangrovihabitans endophyticus]GGK83763.1 sensor histidine kinase [Mangrovihabitans endophyticus]
MKAPTPGNETARLAAMHALDVIDTEPEQDYDDIVTLAARVCDVPVSLISLIDTERQWCKARSGTDLMETSRDLSLDAYAILGGDLLVVPDAREDARFAGNPMVTVDGGIRFYAGAPLVTTDGFAVGALCVLDSQPRRLGTEQLQALRALAAQAVAQMELRRCGTTMTDSTARLQVLERSKDDLAGLIGGDLKSTLRRMSVYLDALGRTGHHDPELADLVGRATAAHVHGLSDLLGHLTAVADTGVGMENLHMRSADLRTLTHDAVEAVRPIAVARGISLREQTGGPALHITADPVRLEQVLTQLLFAAVKYTPSGGRVRVEMEAEPVPTLRLEDLDLADGMRPDLFPHLYYGAIAGSPGEPGPDSGLVAAKKILDAHHATVALSDRPGDGTTLHVAFPSMTPDQRVDLVGV